MTRTMADVNTNRVTFCSSINYCELAIESSDNLYIARFWKNGEFNWSHNCRVVLNGDLPKSRLVTKLRAAVDAYRELIRCYMATDDENTRKELYWSLRGKLEVQS